MYTFKKNHYEAAKIIRDAFTEMKPDLKAMPCWTVAVSAAILAVVAIFIGFTAFMVSMITHVIGIAFINAMIWIFYVLALIVIADQVYLALAFGFNAATQMQEDAFQNMVDSVDNAFQRFQTNHCK